MKIKKEKIYLGNEAIARGMVESGCGFVYSYPGTPASEILPSFVTQAKQEEQKVYGQWTINEKVAMEAALTIAATGMRSAAVMKQVGLNVAADPLMSGAYIGVDGGMVVISADDPGPYSSQTEQDSRFFAMMAKIPVFDPASPADARSMVSRAFTLSEEFQLPVMVRPTSTICHARQNIPPEPLQSHGDPPRFNKEPSRWAATPRHRFVLHQKLNQKLENLRHDPRFAFYDEQHKNSGALAIVASGFAWSLAADIIAEMKDSQARIQLFKVDLPFPLHQPSIEALLNDFSRILVIEETYPVIEMQFGRRDLVSGRFDKIIPEAGELTPGLVETIIYQQLGKQSPTRPEKSTGIIPRRPRLCPGCPHRSSFYALKKTLVNGIYTGDIGCYTLGLNLKALDTCLCMGASITQASAMYQAFANRGTEIPPIAAVIGDSTFYHSGIPALINARLEDSRFVLLLLDNETTAMTGNQPTPASGLRVNGSQGPALPLEKIISGTGISHLCVVDAYEQEKLQDELAKAWRYTQAENGGIAVVIARHPCMMDSTARKEARRFTTVKVTDDCTACGTCIESYECPSLINDESGIVHIDPLTCVACGLCIDVCPFGAIIGE
ncbi:MAG TPA: indolepyruvate oxidoreductase [Proteobacteria bacterium]|nr:indolepyruvate oxidoreductase [Pseudomonadota bacterium]